MPRFSSRARRSRKHVLVQKPHGSLADRVQAVGPEHFGILGIDVAKARFKMMLCDFFGKCLIPPTEFDQASGAIRAAIDRVRQLQQQARLGAVIVALERTGEYHRPLQRAWRAAGFEVRMVHPLTTKQFRQVADPGNKTDDTDLAAIHRAAVNGFGLCEPELPSEYEQLRLIERHRRDLVHKTSAVCCQLREYLHAAMPGYADTFDDLWVSAAAWVVAHATGSAAAVRAAGLEGVQRLVESAGVRCHQSTLHKILAWANAAPPGHAQIESLRRIVRDLDDDRLAKTRQILDLERGSVSLLARTPYVRLLAVPGINVVSAADLAGEMGPISHYADPNAITGRAGLVPARYQSDLVDQDDGSLIRAGNRRLRTALMQIADNLVVCNHYFHAKADLWRQARKDSRWLRVKVAKIFSRIAFMILAGRQPLDHPCVRQRHYVLHKLQSFHLEHDTPMPQLLADLQTAITQLPTSEYAGEARPLQQELERCQRRRGPQPLSEIIPIVLARLGAEPVQLTIEGQDLR
jgi:transposase